jgi:hypothetical protein
MVMEMAMEEEEEDDDDGYGEQHFMCCRKGGISKNPNGRGGFAA